MRLKRGFTQVTLAKRAGLTSTVISHYESYEDARSPGFDSIIALVDALDVSSDYLLGLSHDPIAISINDKLIIDIYNLDDRDMEIVKMMIKKMASKQ